MCRRLHDGRPVAKVDFMPIAHTIVKKPDWRQAGDAKRTSESASGSQVYTRAGSGGWVRRCSSNIQIKKALLIYIYKWNLLTDRDLDALICFQHISNHGLGSPLIICWPFESCNFLNLYWFFWFLTCG